MGTDRFARAHPAVSFCFFAAVILLSVMLLHPVYLALSLLGAAAYLLCLRGRKALLQLAAMLPLFLLITAVSPLLNPLKDAQGGHVVFTLFGRYITWELLANGAMLSAMFIAMLLWFFCYNAIMTGDKFTALFSSLVSIHTLCSALTIPVMVALTQLLIH